MNKLPKLKRERMNPQEGEFVLLKMKGRNRCTRGDGSPNFWGEWHEVVVSASWFAKPFLSECAHFRGHFGIDDEDEGYSQVRLIEWIGFSGRGLLNDHERK